MGNCCSCVNDKNSKEIRHHRAPAEEFDAEFEKSAIKIQAHVRGHQTRRKYNASGETEIVNTNEIRGTGDAIDTMAVVTKKSLKQEDSARFSKPEISLRSNFKFIDEIPTVKNAAIQNALIKLGPLNYSAHKKLTEEFLEYPIYNPVQLENGCIYVGQWKLTHERQSQPPSPLRTSSAFIHAVRHGRGKQFWPDGAIYEGFWRDDKADGYGRLIHTDGDYYEGEWRNDKAHGKGVYFHPNGTFYDGDWEYDLQEGYGTEKYADGSVYTGDFKGGVKNGQGRFKWTDGSSYFGNFKDNKLEGKGRYEWADGRTYDGEWADGKMNGYGVFVWKDGRRYEGYYKDDKKHGFGVYDLGDGRKYEGEWKYGLQDGKGRFTNQTGKTRSGIWNLGKRVQWEGSTESGTTERNNAQSS